MDKDLERQGTFIQRTVRNLPNPNLEELPPHKGYMVVPDKAEENYGIELDEPVSLSPTSSVQYSDEEFEESPSSDEGEGLHDFCDDEDNSDDEIHLDYGIKIKATKDSLDLFGCFTVQEWTAEDKNNSLNIPSSNLIQNSFKFVTEIFKVKLKTNINPNVKSKLIKILNEQEKSLPRKEQCEFSLQNQWIDKFSFQVPLQRQFTTGSNVTNYYAWIYCRDKKWKIVPANYEQDGYVRFSFCRVDSFVIFTTAKNIDGIVHPLGTKLTPSDGLELVFDEGCVESEQNLKYQIHRPDEDFTITEKRLVLGGSEKVTLKYDKSKFNKPFNFTGTLNLDENGSDFVDVTVKLVGYKEDNKPVLFDVDPVHVGKGRYKGQAEGYEGISIVALGRQGNIEILGDTLHNELGVLYGEKKICKLMLFFHKKVGNSLYFISECCLKVESEEVKMKHGGEKHKGVFESEDVFLPPQQRIRIHPSGSITVQYVRPGVQAHSFLFFMYVSKNNTCAFSVQLNRSMSGSPNAMIEFSADNQNRGFITKAEFNIDALNRMNKMASLPLLRVNTSLSDGFRTPRTLSSRDETVLRGNKIPPSRIQSRKMDDGMTPSGTTANTNRPRTEKQTSSSKPGFQRSKTMFS